MRFVPALSLLAATTFAAAAAGAQTASSPKTTVLSIQPLSAMFSVYAAEVEHAIAPAWTLGVGGSNWSPDLGGTGFTYNSGDVKLRYYPEQRAFQGFSFGAQAGYSQITTRTDYGSAGTTRSKASGPTVGVALDYNWLLGPPQTFYVGLGFGAKKIFAKSPNDNATVGYPTARISVGVAF